MQPTSHILQFATTTPNSFVFFRGHVSDSTEWLLRAVRAVRILFTLQFQCFRVFSEWSELVSDLYLSLTDLLVFTNLINLTRNLKYLFLLKHSKLFCLDCTEKNWALSCQSEGQFTICEYRRQWAEQNDIEFWLCLVALINTFVVGDVDSTQVLCFDRLSSVFSQVGGQGEKSHANSSSSSLPALCVTFSDRNSRCNL